MILFRVSDSANYCMRYFTRVFFMVWLWPAYHVHEECKPNVGMQDYKSNIVEPGSFLVFYFFGCDC